MSNVFQAAWVIARRDFVATVFSRTFLLFLLAPLIAMAFGVLIAQMTKQVDVEASRPQVAVVMDSEPASAVRASHARLAFALGELRLPALVQVEPDGHPGQAERLLSSSDENISAVLTGTLEQPLLYGPQETADALGEEMALVIEDARRTQAMNGAGLQTPTVAIDKVITDKSAGSVNMVRHALARAGQILVFILTLLLATMLLSNLVEEKSNKVIEILAAAVPLDAVFLGKLVAMLGVSLVGVVIWGSIAAFGMIFIEQIMMNLLGVEFRMPPVTPAVGWPTYSILLVLYFSANYMLLGAVFLGIGGQASNVREVQTLSMPINFAQIMIFALASAAVGNHGGTMTWIAAIFPLSSPMTMIALAAQMPTIWWHLVALLWQLLWIALIIHVSARMFRLTIMKSHNREGFFDFLRKPRREENLPAE